jgi:hypothetical protein
MATKSFRPYQTTDAIDLRVRDCVVDGVSRLQLVNDGGHRVELGDAGEWAHAELHVVVEDQEALRRTLPTDERGDPPLRVAALVTCPDTKLREPTVLERRGPNWEGVVRLERTALRGTASMRATAVRAKKGAVLPGLAHRIGAEVGHGPNWTLAVDDAGAPPGTFIQTRWVRFSTDDRFRHYSRATHYLDLGSEAVLYLNEEVEGFKAVMLDNGKTTVTAALSSALTSAIVRSAWPTIIVAAALGATEDEDGHFLPDTEWGRAALEQFAPHLAREDDRTTAIDVLVKRLRSGEDAARALCDIEGLVQNRFNMRQEIERLLEKVRDH